MEVEILTQTGMSIKEMANTAIQQYSLRDADIAALAEECATLHVEGVEDKKGLQLVHEARMVVREKRVFVESVRVELKAGSLEFGRIIDGEAKRLTKPLVQIEERLKAQEDAVAAEKERIHQEAEAARLQVLRDRMDLLDAVEARMPTMLVETFDEEEFAKALAHATEHFEARQREAATERAREEAAIAERQREDEAAAKRRRVEEAKLAAGRAELDRQRAESDRLAADRRKAEEAKLAEDRARLDEERAAVDAQAKAVAEREERAASAERAKREAEAAEQARAKAKADAEQAQKARALAEEEEAKRLDKLKPHVERVMDYLEELGDIDLPEGPFAEMLQVELDALCERVRREVSA